MIIYIWEVLCFGLSFVTLLQVSLQLVLNKGLSHTVCVVASWYDFVHVLSTTWPFYAIQF